MKTRMMRRLAPLALVLASACVVIGPDGVAVPGTGIGTSPEAAAAADAFVGIRPDIVPTTDPASISLNRQRTAAGVTPLARLPALDGVARARALDLARTGMASETDATGRSAADRIDTVCSRDSVELIATEADSFEAAVSQWMVRPSAARVLELRRWNYFGAAGEGRVWVLDLAVICEV